MRGWIVQVSGNDCLDRADDHACRLELRLDSVRAEVALLCGVGVWIDVQRVVGAGLHARLAADAAVAVEIDDAVIASEQRSHRTDRNARRVVAMIAPEHREEAPSVGILALLDVLDPSAKCADGNFVFGLAGDRAGVAADAPAMVDDEAVFHLVSSADFSLFLPSCRPYRLKSVLHRLKSVLLRVW